MCGIHGIFNKSSFGRVAYSDFVRDAFVANALRGMDSSGIFQLDKSGKPYVFKEALPGPSFIEGKMAKQFISDASSSVITLCHVRAATQGKVTADNAHPFTAHKPETGNRLIGVHNGTLTGWQSKPGAKGYDVDSAWALNHIAEYGAKAFEDFSGAFTFVWWDEDQKDKVFIARNDQRPMFFALTKDESAMVLASEAGMLSWLCERNKLETDGNIYQVESGQLYTFDLSTNKITWSKAEYPKFRYATTTSSSYNFHNRYYNANNVPLVDDEDDGYYGTSYGSYTDTRRERILDEVKEAMRLNRAERFQRETAKANEAGAGETKPVEIGTPPARKSKRERRKERAAAREAAKQAAAQLADDGVPGEDESIYDERCREEWYSVATATGSERQVAKSLGLMGSLQWFRGELYDTDTCEVFGEFEEYESGIGKVKYRAVLRNVTSSIADRLWINGPGDWVAVIGASNPEKDAAREYVVCELNSIGKKKLKERAA